MTASAEALITVDAVSKHFPVRGGLFGKRTTVRAVEAMSFAIDKGETLGLIGESGCGKTTTAKLILLQEQPTSGAIFFDGADNFDGVRANLAGIIDAQEAALFVVQRVTVILVQGAFAVGSRIDA